VSWVVVALSVLQIGANSNYFWEPLLVSAIGAGHGLVWFVRNVNRGSGFLKASTALVLWLVFFPVLKTEFFQIRVSYGWLRTHDHARAQWELFLSRITGLRILSTFPEISIQSRVPEIPDPFLNNVLAQRGMWDFTPILRDISSTSYDVVIVGADLAAGSSFHRGLGIWPMAVWQALERNYARACVLKDYRGKDYRGLGVWVPRVNNSSKTILRICYKPY
jgi:hypothetical protein